VSATEIGQTHNLLPTVETWRISGV